MSLINTNQDAKLPAPQDAVVIRPVVIEALVAANKEAVAHNKTAWASARAAIAGLTFDELEAHRAAFRETLTANKETRDATFAAYLQNMARFVKGGAEIPESWNKETIKALEKMPRLSSRGKPTKTKESEATGEAIDGETGEIKDAKTGAPQAPSVADPLAKFWEALHAGVKDALNKGVKPGTILLAIVNLADEAEAEQELTDQQDIANAMADADAAEYADELPQVVNG